MWNNIEKERLREKQGRWQFMVALAALSDGGGGVKSILNDSKKTLILLNLFGNLKGQKFKNLLNISKNIFFIQILDFHCPFKILCHTSKL